MFSPHLDFQSNVKSLDLSDEIPQKDGEKKRWNTNLQPGPGQASEDASLLSGLEVWGTDLQSGPEQSCLLPATGGIDCSGN